MHDILVLGAGKIGSLISGLLAESDNYHVQLGDAQRGAAAEVADAHKLTSIKAFNLDATDADALSKHIEKHKPSAVVSSLPYYCNEVVARVARGGADPLDRIRAFENDPRGFMAWLRAHTLALDD